MKIDEIQTSRLILDGYAKKLGDALSVDVAIAGGGPSGLVAAYDLARAGKKVALFERRLSPGGGMWGGAMGFNELAVEKDCADIVEEMGIRYRVDGDSIIADSVEATGALVYRAVNAGATLLNMVNVEDVAIRDGRVFGFVINWTTIELARLIVDPLVIEARAVIEATGHDCVIANHIIKHGFKLDTPSGGIEGEGPMWAEQGEAFVVDKTGLIYPSVYASGMAVCGVFGGPRMGPIFGGMLKSGRKVARMILDELG